MEINFKNYDNLYTYNVKYKKQGYIHGMTFTAICYQCSPRYLEKRWDFNCLLKLSMSVKALMPSGREFHILGPTTGNERPPKVSHLYLRVSNWTGLLAERKL